ncbi:flagellin [Hyphomonas sp.]|uniref:flagellin N-terminal helical domain-containing protein n=1 Tax=Hyphomonas sp. TaxID=87 RepID=UPI0025BEA854|nr:flagellin [Hyphomonas sp.]
MSSILTNNSAMVALETLRNVNRNLESVQSEISTGKKVATAKDNAGIWAVATVMSSDVESFKQISDSLNLGAATVGVARGASEQIVKTLQEIKNLVVTAQGENVDRAKIQTDIDAKTALIQGFVDAAQFNGLNLIDGTATADVEVLSSLNRDSSGAVTAANITVERQDLATTAGGGLAALTAVDVSTSSVTAAAGLVSIETLLQTAIDAAAAFGSSQASIKSQADFVTTLTDSLKAGVGSLTDSDIEAASAKLQALQVQQQLGVQALSIANQQPQALLSLFR